MATNYLTDYGKADIAAGNCGTAAVLKLMLVTSAYTPSRTDQFVSAASAAEISTTNYTGGYGGGGRKVIASLAVTTDTTNHRAYLSNSPTVFAALGTSGGPQTAYCLLIRETGGSDATSILVGVWDCVNDCFGLDLTFTPAATGTVLLN